MTTDPIVIGPDDSIQEAAELMLEYQVSGLPVVVDGRIVGIITESDIFRLVVKSWTELVAQSARLLESSHRVLPKDQNSFVF
ncbi:MAG: CBS domain-containing protein [Caldilineaceae bacterium]